MIADGMDTARTSLSESRVDALVGTVSGTRGGHGSATAARQPVHTVYGGGHLFRADVAGKLGGLAMRLLERYASTPETLAAALGRPADDLWRRVHERAVRKLQHEPVEDYRIDFEDGYGYREDAQEDAHAAQAARELLSLIHI